MAGSLKTADIIILGAGPAGCAAAIRAGQAGLKVCLLDANAKAKSAPGETLHPGIEAIFKQLCVLEPVLQAGFLRQPGIRVQNGSNPEFVPYGADAAGPWRGFQADRKVLHEILQQAAQTDTSFILRNMRAQAVLSERGRVVGVQVNGQPMYADWVLDATGRQAWLAKQLGLPISCHSPPLGVRFGWREAEPATWQDCPLFTFRDDGWDWQARLANGKQAWASLLIGPNAGGLDVTWRLCRDCAGPGYFILGDAAAIFDPASSHGVLRALMSGIYCAHLLAAWYQAKADDANVSAAYQTWLCGQFAHDQRHLLDYYAQSRAAQQFFASMPLTLFPPPKL